MSVLLIETANLRQLLHEEHGVSAADRALAAVLSLGLILLVARAILGGSGHAADNAKAMLEEQDTAVSWSDQPSVAKSSNGVGERAGRYDALSEEDGHRSLLGGLASKALMLGSVLPGALGTQSTLLDAALHALEGDSITATIPFDDPIPNDSKLEKRVSRVPMREGHDSDYYDGAFAGGDGKFYTSNTPLSQVPPVLPDPAKCLRVPCENSPSDSVTIIYVPGIDSPVANFPGTLKEVANATHSPVIGVYNSTSGNGVLDAVTMNEKSRDSVANSVYSQVISGKPVHLAAHSQGTWIVRDALEQVRDRLLADGKSQEEAKAVLSRVTVDTFAAVVPDFPDGPNYIHHRNTKDSMVMNHGPYSGALNRHPGEGARDVPFTDPDEGGDPHNLSVYLRPENRLAGTN